MQVQQQSSTLSQATHMDEGTLTIRANAHTVLHYIEIHSLLEVKSVKVYSTRVSIEVRSKLGAWEHRDTYPLSDFGDIYITKGRSRATVGVHTRSSSRILFEVDRLTHRQAEALKDVLDILLDARQQQLSSSRVR